jgi:hypothetical protein
MVHGRYIIHQSDILRSFWLKPPRLLKVPRPLKGTAIIKSKSVFNYCRLALADGLWPQHQAALAEIGNVTASSSLDSRLLAS